MTSRPVPWTTDSFGQEVKSKVQRIVREWLVHAIGIGAPWRAFLICCHFLSTSLLVAQGSFCVIDDGEEFRLHPAEQPVLLEFLRITDFSRDGQMFGGPIRLIDLIGL